MRQISLLTCSVFFLLFGYLFLGISHIAFLPPWEGFDETAHFSYIQQVADTHTVPEQGTALLSKDVESYISFGPVRYATSPPVEDNGGYTYKSFFESTPGVISRCRDYIHNNPEISAKYTEGTIYNWQSQHPPLFYILLSPVYLATKSFSRGAQLFILRLTSYALALVALLAAVFGCDMFLKRTDEDKRFYVWSLLGILLWPALFPSWFPEMARLGNDSLCAFIAALIWLVSVRAYVSGFSYRHAVLIGVLLGLGCFTKPFFVPVSAGVLFFWLFRLKNINGEKNISQTVRYAGIMILIISCISGGWYISKLIHQGVFLGSDEMVALYKAGGLFDNLVEKFKISEWVRGHASFLTTFVWSGTWSLARPPYIFLAMLAFIFLIAAAAYIISLRNHKCTSLEFLSAWIAVPVFLGFSYHVLVRIALTGHGMGTSGYYLHFLAVPLGAALGSGLGHAWRKNAFRKITAFIFIYTVVFSIIISWAQVMLFAGILYKQGSVKFYQAPEILPLFFGIPEALKRLDAIAFPTIGIIAWFIGGILMLAGLYYAWKCANQFFSDNKEIKV